MDGAGVRGYIWGMDFRYITSAARAQGADQRKVLGLVGAQFFAGDLVAGEGLDLRAIVQRDGHFAASHAAYIGRRYAQVPGQQYLSASLGANP